MKKTPIILGAMASILAIAGAFTTKANSKVDTVTGYTASGATVHVSCSGAQGICRFEGNTVFTSPNPGAKTINTKP